MLNLVTGATGHIGNVLVRELLSKNEKVRVFVLPGDSLESIAGLDIDIVYGNILNPSSLSSAMQNVDCVFHLAGMISILPGDADKLNLVNVEGTKNVLQTARNAAVNKFVYVSSIHALGAVKHGITIDETIPFNPENVMGDYDKSKARASQLVVEAAKDGYNAIIVCPTGVLGPYDFNHSEMGSLVESMMHTSVAFSVKGSYDFVDVRDVARGLVLAAEKGLPGEIYILSGEYIAIEKILYLASRFAGRKIPIINVPLGLAKLAARISPAYCRLTHQKAHLTPYSLSTIQSNSIVTHQKATSDLGYNPRTIQDSIRDMVYWFREKNLITQ